MSEDSDDLSVALFELWNGWDTEQDMTPLVERVQMILEDGEYDISNYAQFDWIVSLAAQGDRQAENFVMWLVSQGYVSQQVVRTLAENNQFIQTYYKDELDEFIVRLVVERELFAVDVQKRSAQQNLQECRANVEKWKQSANLVGQQLAQQVQLREACDARLQQLEKTNSDLNRAKQLLEGEKQSLTTQIGTAKTYIDDVAKLEQKLRGECQREQQRIQDAVDQYVGAKRQLGDPVQPSDLPAIVKQYRPRLTQLLQQRQQQRAAMINCEAQIAAKQAKLNELTQRIAQVNKLQLATETDIEKYRQNMVSIQEQFNQQQKELQTKQETIAVLQGEMKALRAVCDKDEQQRQRAALDECQKLTRNYDNQIQTNLREIAILKNRLKRPTPEQTQEIERLKQVNEQNIRILEKQSAEYERDMDELEQSHSRETKLLEQQLQQYEQELDRLRQRQPTTRSLAWNVDVERLQQLVDVQDKDLEGLKQKVEGLNRVSVVQQEEMDKLKQRNADLYIEKIGLEEQLKAKDSRIARLEKESSRAQGTVRSSAVAPSAYVPRSPLARSFRPKSTLSGRVPQYRVGRSLATPP